MNARVRGYAEGLLTVHSLDFHSQAVKTFAGGDEEGIAVFPAEANVGSPGFVHGNMLDALAIGVEDGDPVAGEIDISLVIDGHAVGTEFAEEFFAGQGTVGFDLVAEGFLCADVSHVEGPAIRRADDAVGLSQVVDDANE